MAADGAAASTKPAAPDGSLLDTAAEKLRDSAKWLIAAFGAIGAALVTGIQFSSLGNLGGWNLAVALIGAGLVLAGVSLAIFSVAGVLAPVGRTLNDVAQKAAAYADSKNSADPVSAFGRDPAAKFFDENPELLRAFGSVADLKKAFDRDYDLYVAAFAAWHANPNQDTQSALQAAKLLGEPTEQIAKEVVDWANYQTLVAAFRRMLYRRVVPALAFVAAGLVLFIIKVTSPAPAPPASLPAVKLAGADLTAAQLAGADLKGADLARTKLVNADLSKAILSKATLNGADLTGANLSEAKTRGASFDGTIWSHTTCPDGTNSDDANSSCQAHLLAAK